MKHLRLITKNKPAIAQDWGDIFHYVDSFGWLFVNFMNYVVYFSALLGKAIPATNGQ